MSTKLLEYTRAKLSFAHKPHCGSRCNPHVSAVPPQCHFLTLRWDSSERLRRPVVLVPVQLTDLIFPNRRNQPWLKKAGMIISSLTFVLGSFIAWFLWTQNARPHVFHVPKYQPPFLAFFFGLLSILLLTFAAYALRNVGPHASRAQATSSTPSPWTVAIVTLGFGFPWYLLMFLIFGPKRDIPLWVPIIAGIVWASVIFFVIQRWVSSSGWSDIHRWALVFPPL